jgi:hypothetical protein
VFVMSVFVMSVFVVGRGRCFFRSRGGPTAPQPANAKKNKTHNKTHKQAKERPAAGSFYGLPIIYCEPHRVHF